MIIFNKAKFDMKLIMILCFYQTCMFFRKFLRYYTLITFLLNFSDIDECISNLCDKNATCENFVGSYNCTCKKGFTGGGTTCKGDQITELIMNNICKSTIVRFVLPDDNVKSFVLRFHNWIFCQETFHIIF